MSNERPFIVKQDGTITDRATGTIVGTVVLTSDGWASSRYAADGLLYGGSKGRSARKAWEAWWESLPPDKRPPRQRDREAEREQARLARIEFDRARMRAHMGIDEHGQDVR